MRRLSGDWWGYAQAYEELRQRRPLLELHDHLRFLSESHNASSWCGLVEEPLRDWVDRGCAPSALPLDDRHNYLTPKVRARLAAIRSATRGWIYKSAWFMTDRETVEMPCQLDALNSHAARIRAARSSFEGL